MENLENALLAQLKSAKASAATLKSASAAMASVRKSDFSAYRILIDKLHSLKPIWESPLLRDIKLFPYGIIAPEGFDVRVRFNTNAVR
jgi:hypothetical protein